LIACLTPVFSSDLAFALEDAAVQKAVSGEKATDYIQLTGVTDIRSKFSDGCNTVRRLAEMSTERGIDVMILTDHDRYSLEYGIFPFRGIIKKKISKSSLLLNGADEYLKAIANLQYEFHDLIAIPGVESAPFYYWTGGIFSKDLTANLWENHIGIYGMQNPEDYEGLPTLNSNLSMKYFGRFFKGFLLFFLSAITGLILIFFGERFRIAGIVILVINALFMISYQPFRSSPFDQYHGPQGVRPWQLTIDYANAHGGMTFWHHPESSSGIGRKKSIFVNTPPHPQDLLLTHGYTGFQAVYEDTITVTEPGHEWDQTLMQYLRGERDHAVWGIGGHDFHCEGTSGIHFDDVKTVFLVEHKDKDAVLRAMRKGRMYAVRQPRGRYRLSLDAFTIRKQDGTGKAFMGEAVPLTAFPDLHIKISATNGKPKKFTLTVVRSGEVIKEMTSTTPLDLHYVDHYCEPGQAVFYRLKATVNQGDYLVSNPIFVLFHAGEGEGPEGKTAPEKKAVEGPAPPATQTAGSAVTPPAQKTEGSPPKKIAQETRGTDKGEEAGIAPIPSQVHRSPGGPSQKPGPEEGKIPPAASRKNAPSSAIHVGKILKSPQKAADALAKRFVTVKAKSVNLRKGPGIRFKKLKKVKKGARFRLIKITSSLYKKIPWMKVSNSAGEFAYVWGGGVVPAREGKLSGGPGNEKAGISKRVSIVADKAIVRKGPGRRYPKITTASRGQQFLLRQTTDVLYRQKPWLKVSDRNGKTGYIWSGLVDLRDNP